MSCVEICIKVLLEKKDSIATSSQKWAYIFIIRQFYNKIDYIFKLNTST